MIKELILTTMFSFAPLINGVSPSKADVFFSSSDSETSQEVVTLDDGKTYRKVYDAQSNDVNSTDDLVDGNAYRLNFFDFSGQDITFNDCGIFHFFFHQYGGVFISYFSNPYVNFFYFDEMYLTTEEDMYFNGSLSAGTGETDFIDFYFYDKSNVYSGDLVLWAGYEWSDLASYDYSEFDYAYTYLIFDSNNFIGDNGLPQELPFYLYYFFENAGDNLPYHYEEIVKGHTLFDIINDWYLSLFSNETLDSYTFNLFGKEVSMTQYLCNVATIITLVSLVIAVVSITIFIFKLSAGLFKW